MNKDRAAMVGVANWQSKRDVQIKCLRHHGLTPEHFVLDYGCGVLRGGVPIINFLNNGKYFGYDVSAKRLEEGQKELEESGLQDKDATLSGSIIDRCYDFIWSYQVLIHMNDNSLTEFMNVVSNCLDPNGKALATVYIGKPKNLNWMEFPFVHRPLELYVTCAQSASLRCEVVRDFTHPALDNQLLLFTKEKI